MLYKISVSLKTEGKSCFPTLPYLDHKLDKILSSIEAFNECKSEMLIFDFDGNERMPRFDSIDTTDHLEICSQILEFLNVAGAHSAILNPTHNGVAAIARVDILEIFNDCQMR